MTVKKSPELTIAGLIHDLNNVFQTISEISELLSTEPKWSKVGRTLHRSVERGQRIARSLVEDKPSVANFASVVRRAMEFVRDYLEAVHGPHVEFERRIERGFRVPGDPDSWERVLVNLFLNSAEAGGKNIDIAATRNQMSNEITISDDGPGIPPEMLPTIFHPHVSTKSIMSGLGLYVVRSIVESYGGTVTASNGETGGAVFRIGTPNSGAQCD
jgi:signal transduction histidine kinase